MSCVLRCSITQNFKTLPLLGILRGIAGDAVEPLLESAVSAGLTAVEITMNTPNACQLIEQMSDIAAGRLSVGAGTVLNLDDLSNARSAGAEFIVTPIFIETVSTQCAKQEIPLFPGALTPKEVYDAWQAGAEMIKLFPASCFGPKYIKELRGPFDDIKILACGGVSETNIGEYISCGANGAAFGGSIFRQDWIENREFDRIQAAILTFKQAFQSANKIP